MYLSVQWSTRHRGVAMDVTRPVVYHGKVGCNTPWWRGSATFALGDHPQDGHHGRALFAGEVGVPKVRYRSRARGRGFPQEVCHTLALHHKV